MGGQVSRLLDVNDSVLLVVDMQEKFVPVIGNYMLLTEQVARLIKACARLSVPVIVSEQYPKGLGHTVEALQTLLPASAVTLEKTAFGCLGDAGIRDALRSLGRRQVIVCGIEAHVCVSQTVHQLLAEGYQPHLVEDAIASRSDRNAEIAVRKMAQSGAIPTGIEQVLFELLGNAKHEAFKEVQALIK